jgi:hypothetical protein
MIGLYRAKKIREYERIRTLNSKRHKENITIFIRKLSDYLTDFHVSLADRLTEFSEMKDDDDSNINLQNITSGEKPISDEVKNFFEDQEYNNIKLLKHSEDKKIKEESKEIKNISININNTNEIIKKKIHKKKYKKKRKKNKSKSGINLSQIK